LLKIHPFPPHPPDAGHVRSLAPGLTSPVFRDLPGGLETLFTLTKSAFPPSSRSLKDMKSPRVKFEEGFYKGAERHIYAHKRVLGWWRVVVGRGAMRINDFDFCAHGGGVEKGEF